MDRRSLPLLLALVGCAESTTRTASGALEVVTVRLAYNNAHAVAVEGGTLLVDAGLERDAEALAGALSAAGVDPAGIALVVLTHGHADHAGGARWLRETYGTPILAGAGDRALVEAGRNDRLCPTDATARERLDAAQAETFEPSTPDILVSEPLDLAELGLAGTVTPVGSHTEGSLVLDVGDALFAGDLLRGSVLGGEATTHYYQCDPAAAEAAVATTLAASDAPYWFVGHFGPLTREAVARFVEGA